MTTIICTFLYKIITILTGFSLALLGYKLFIAGVYSGGGDLETIFKDNKLVLKKSSPGIFFALFGTVIISLSMWSGLDLKQEETHTPKSISLTEKDKIAIGAIETIISQSSLNESIVDYEINAIKDLILKISTLENQETKRVASRGIASEQED